MSFLMNATNHIKVLSQINPAKNSVDFDDQSQLQSTPKISCCSMGVRWFFHIITLFFVPLNSPLDRACKKVLKDIKKAAPSFTPETLELSKNAIENLMIVIRKNGGSQERQARKILETVQNIQHLNAVKTIANRQTELNKVPPNIPVIHKPEETTLKKKAEEVVDPVDIPMPPEAIIQKNDISAKFIELESLIYKAEKDERIKPITHQILLELKEVKTLTIEQQEVLIVAFSYLEKEWVKGHAKNLSPEVIEFFVHSAIHNRELPLAELLVGLTQQPINHEKIVTFVNSFSAYQNVDLDYFFVDLQSFLVEFKAHCFLTMQQELSEDQLKNFIINLLCLAVFQAKAKNQPPIAEIDLFPEYKPMLLEILSKVKDLETLVKLLQNGTLNLEVIFRNNPPKDDELNDVFLEQLLIELFKGTFFKWKIYSKKKNRSQLELAEKDNRQFIEIIKRSSEFLFNDIDVRKRALIDQLPFFVIAVCADQLPVEFLENLTPPQLIKIALELNNRFLCNQTDENILKAIAKAFKQESLDLLMLEEIHDSELKQGLKKAYKRNAIKKLFSFLPHDLKVRCLTRILEGNKGFSYAEVLKQAFEHEIPLIEEASQQLPLQYVIPLQNAAPLWDLPYKPEVLAQIVNGQKNNKNFIIAFFKHYFPTQENVAERIKCCEYLKPEIFNFIEPEDIEEKNWIIFFKTLKEVPDKEIVAKLLVPPLKKLYESLDEADRK